MMKKFSSLIVFLLLMGTMLLAQQNIRGVVIDATSKLPLAGVFVKVEGSKAITRTNEQGEFRLTKLKKGKKNLIFEFEDHQTLTKEVNSDEGLVKLGTVELGKPEASTSSKDAFQTITLDDATAVDDASDDQNVASQLGASRDLFRQYTNFAWSSVRYRTRGYISNYTETYFNGIPFNDLDDERASFGAYSGLNDVTRLSTNYQGLEPNSYAFGDLAGSSNVDTRASNQRKQTRLSYMNANRAFSHRIMGTYATGLMPNGWAFAASGSRRWAQEGYVPGTFMDAAAYFVSVDKIFGVQNNVNPDTLKGLAKFLYKIDGLLSNKHSFNLTIFGSPNKQGATSPTVHEMFDLSGDCFYNRNWGYQEGKKRNSVVNTRHAPTMVLRHDFKINEKSNLTSAASLQLESNGRTNISFFNARNPLPDYYSGLPSGADGQFQRDLVTEVFKESESTRQMNWNYMYQTNYNSFETIKNAGGIQGNNVSGKRAKYFLGEDHQDSKETNIYTNYQNNVSDHFQLVGGAALRYFQGTDYRLVKDLLGADFAVDVDQFAERTNANGIFGQNDLSRPNRILKVGDTTGYKFNNNVRNAFAWAQGSWSYNKFDFFVSAKGSFTEFWRTGLTKNGRFPDNSLGDSERRNFLNFGTKGGITYKLDGRNYFNVYGGYMTKAPNSRDAYLSPRTRNEFASNLKSEKITSVEGSYHHRAPKFSAEITGYYTLFKDKVRAFSFFSDEDQSFVNYVAQGLDMRHTGIEAAAEYKVNSQLEVFGAATLSQHLYWSRPTATATPDNGVTSVQSNLNGKTVYIKGFYIPNTPQTAATVGFKYNGKKFWFVNVNANYFGNRYMDINFNRRTDYAVTAAIGQKTITKGEPVWNQILEQKKLDDAFTVNVLAGKSFKVKDYYINITVGVDNVLDEKYVSSAFEQWRFDNVKKDVNKFPPRYFYAWGRNYFAQVALRF